MSKECKLAMRKEDGYWNAYRTDTGTRIGSLLISVAVEYHGVDLTFRHAMQQVVDNVNTEVFRKSLGDWIYSTAAPGERAYHSGSVK